MILQELEAAKMCFHSAWIDELWYIQAIEYYSAPQKNKTL